MGITEYLGKSVDELRTIIAFEMAKRFGPKAESVYVTVIGSADTWTLEDVQEECGVVFTEEDVCFLKLIWEARELEWTVKRNLINAIKFNQQEGQHG